MNSHWETRKLKEIADYFIGLTYSPKDVSNKGTIVLRSSNIQDGKLDLSDIVRVKKSVKENLNVIDGDILMCSRNGSKRLVGKTAMIEGLKENMTFGTFMTVIRSDINPYLIWFFKSDEFRKQINGGENTMINQITKYMLDDIEIPIPPPDEQKRIIKILKEAFSSISTAEKNTEQNLTSAHEIFAKYSKSLFETPPKSWKLKTLAEVCEFRNGQAHEQNIDPNGEFILINSKFIASNGSTFKRTNDVLAPLYKGDIVFVMSDVPNGKALAKCFLIDKANTYSLNQRIGAITSKHFESKFLYYQLNRNDYLLSFNNGENQTNLRKPDILKCPLWLPPRDEQKKICLKLDQVWEETNKLINQYEKKLADLNELKRSILHKAFNGEL